MYALVLILVLAVAVYLVGRPFFQPDSAEEAMLLMAPAPFADRERDHVFAALTEIENDYQTGKLSDVDYDALKAEYVQKAVALLRAESGLAASRAGRPERRLDGPSLEDLQAAAEAEVARALKSRGGGSAGTSSAPAPVANVGQMAFCSACGSRLLSGEQKFCHSCGKPLVKEA